MQGKIVRTNDLLKIVGCNVVNQSGKVGPMGLESIHPAALSRSGSCQNCVYADISTDVIEDIPGFNILVYPINGTGLLQENF